MRRSLTAALAAVFLFLTFGAQAGNLNLPQFTGDVVTSGPNSALLQLNNSEIARQHLGAAGRGANNDITALGALTTPIPISGGGTGGHDAASARTGIGAAAAGANADITALTGLQTPIPVAGGGTGANNLPNDFQTETTKPFFILGTGQSNSLGYGEGVTAAVNHTGGDIWIWYDQQQKFVVANYGTYPLLDTPPNTPGVWSPNPSIEFANKLRESGDIQSSRPIYVMLSSMIGKSISNWSAEKYDFETTPVLQGPTPILYAMAQLTAAQSSVSPSLLTNGVLKIHVIFGWQGEEDSISSVCDTFNTAPTTVSPPCPTPAPGSIYTPYGFGNMATGLVVGPYSSSATVSAVQAAGGFNTTNGYLAAIKQAFTNLRGLPGANDYTPILWGELGTYPQASEFARNDVIRTLPTITRNMAVVPSTGLTGSLVAGNTNHFDGKSVQEIGSRARKAYKHVLFSSFPVAPPGTLGAPSSGSPHLSIINNVDQAVGVAQSFATNMYMISGDQLRGPEFSAYISGTSLYLPPAANVGPNVDLDINVWSTSSGPSYILSLQPLVGWPGPFTVGPYALPAGTQNLYSYPIPNIMRARLISGSGRWSLLAMPADPGLYRGNFFNASANIGQNAATAFLTSTLSLNSTFTLAYSVGGVPATVSATYDGSTNTTSDNTIAAIAAALQTALGSSYTVDAIPGANALTVMGPSQVTFNPIGSSVTGGTSTPTIGAETGVYAISPRLIGQVWSCYAGVVYVVPPSNLNDPGDTQFLATGGGGTAGKIYIDSWTDLIIDRNGDTVSGGWGANPFVGVEANQTVKLSPSATTRWSVDSGSYMTPPNALAQGGTLYTNAANLALSAALVSGNSVSISGTETLSGGSATAIPTVTQPFIQSSSITLGLTAKALQAALRTVDANAIVTVPYNQNLLQIDLSANASLALTGSVTGGSTQPTVTPGAGTYNISLTQLGKDYYLPASGGNVVLPTTNFGLAERIGLNGTALSSTSQGNITAASGLFFTRGGLASSSLSLRPQMTMVLEAGQLSRWEVTGGSYPSWREGQLIASPATGSSQQLTSGAQVLMARITGSNIAALTLTFPTSPADGDEVDLSFEENITTLTLSGSVCAPPASITASSSAPAGYEWKFMKNGSRWQCGARW